MLLKCTFIFTLNYDDRDTFYFRLCRLHREVEAFVNYISPTPIEDEIRSLVVDLVSKAVTQAFPDAQVKPFGSFGTKLYLPLGYVPVHPDSMLPLTSDTIS